MQFRRFKTDMSDCTFTNINAGFVVRAPHESKFMLSRAMISCF